MIYIFDSDVLINLFKNIYRGRFPSLWQKFDTYVIAGRIISVREVFREIGNQDDQLSEWAKQNRDIFVRPSPEELAFITEIFKVNHFQMLVRTQERLQGKPVADPFVIAKAKIIQGCVVTEEKLKPTAAKIPNVCEHFGVAHLNLEGFMEKENWIF
jgi:Tfp pilus assembly protein PilP